VEKKFHNTKERVEEQNFIAMKPVVKGGVIEMILVL
jgi:hypothetical protein